MTTSKPKRAKPLPRAPKPTPRLSDQERASARCTPIVMTDTQLHLALVDERLARMEQRMMQLLVLVETTRVPAPSRGSPSAHALDCDVHSPCSCGKISIPPPPPAAFDEPAS